MKQAEVFRGISTKMKVDFEKISASIEHSAIKGSAREETMRKFLKRYLPEKYRVGMGQVMATSGEISKQQDVIVYDSFNCPLLLNEQNVQIFPAESVYAAVEVKSTLSKIELEDCVQKVRSVRRLPKLPGERRIGPNVTVGGATSPTGGYVFSYSADTSLETLKNNLTQINSQVPLNEQIHTVCVLGEGLITSFDAQKNTYIIGDSGIPKVVRDLKEDSLLWFYLLLMS